MTLQRVIWRAQDACKFSVVDEGEPFAIKATPTITSYSFGITVGLFFRNQDTFGYWYSSNTCDLITAWRVAQILSRIKTMRNRGGYDSTMCGLVIAMNGDHNKDRMRERAKDLGMSIQELDVELKRLNQLWPTQSDLCPMWDKLSTNEQDKLAGVLRDAIASNKIEANQELINRIEVAELRLRDYAQQKEYEELLIATGLEPEASLRQLLLDIGVTNLIYTVGFGGIGDQTHFEFDDLDRVIMRWLIGSFGSRERVMLVTTAKQPDDPSTHFSEGGGGITVHWNDFGDFGHPRIMLGSESKELVSVRWDRVTERFLLTLRPTDLSERDNSQDVEMSIIQLRTDIGSTDGMLNPGQPAPWCKQPRSSRSGLLRRRT